MSDAKSRSKSIIFNSDLKPGKHMAQAIKKAKSIITQKEFNESSVNLKQQEGKGYRSKLVICIDILCSLVTSGPLNFSQLSHKVELDTVRLTPHLKFLIDRGLLEQENWNENEAVYVVTESGLKILKVVNPIIKEAHKIQIRDFELISNTLSDAGYS